MIALDHIGIAVRELAPILQVLEDVLSLRPYKSEEVANDRVRTHFLRGGHAKLELVESLHDDSPIARYVDKRGEGLHHLAFEVDDLDETYERLAKIGYRPIDDQPRRGADGKRIFFLHPKDTAGILIEFCQSARPILGDGRTAGGLHIRDTGAEHLPLLAYLHSPREDQPRDELLRVLEPSFSIRAIEIPVGGDPVELQKLLPRRAAVLLAIGAAIPAALRCAAPPHTLAASLVLVHPGEDQEASRAARRHDVQIPTLLIARDDPEMHAAAYLRRHLPGSRLAVLPYDDATATAGLIERHARSVG